MPELSQGTEFAGHRIEGVAGQGGMGVVYKATHLALDITVALKLIKPDLASDPDFRERFKNESRLAASIEHPNVLPVRHAGEEDGLLYITMRYVDGTDLRSLIDRTGRIDPARTAAIMSEIGDALDAAHAGGLVHRDVKPANVLLEGADGSGHAYLTDFGLTRHTGSGAGLTKTGQWVGTLDYVAPEQIEGRPVDARSDVYALGCVLYESLTGQVPFLKDSEVATMYAHLNEPAPRPHEQAPDLPQAIDDVIDRAMAKNPDDRYPSAGDLAAAATAATTGTAVVQPERSVAAGKAAPGGAAVGAAAAPAPTRAPPPPPPPAGAGETRASPVPVPGGGPAPPPARSDAPTRGGFGGRRALFAGLGALALIAVVVGVLFAAGVIGGDDAEENAQDQAAREAAEEQAAEEEAAAQESAAEETVNGFRDAFSNEGLSTIELLLAPDTPYKYLGFKDTPAVDEYRDIFSALDVKDYQLTVDELSFEEDSSPPAVDAKLTYEYETGEGNRASGNLEWQMERESDEGDFKIAEITATPDFYTYFTIANPPVSYAVDLYAGRTTKIGQASGTIQADGKDVPIRIPIDPGEAVDLNGSETLRSISSFREKGGPSTDTAKLTFPYAS